MSRTLTHTRHIPANPYIICAECGERVRYWRVHPIHGIQTENYPCGHRADWINRCPSWGPVDGCSCNEHFGYRPHKLVSA